MVRLDMSSSDVPRKELGVPDAQCESTSAMQTCRDAAMKRCNIMQVYSYICILHSSFSTRCQLSRHQCPSNTSCPLARARKSIDRLDLLQNYIPRAAAPTVNPTPTAPTTPAQPIFLFETKPLRLLAALVFPPLPVLLPVVGAVPPVMLLPP